MRLTEEQYRTILQRQRPVDGTVPYIPPAEPHDNEHQMQAAVMRWVLLNEERHPVLEMLFAVPNGGFRSKATGGKLRVEGLKAGVPDLLLPCPMGIYLGLAIECKVGRNKPTAKQAWWLERLETVGWRVAVCYTADEAIAVLSAYIGLP